jgi:hypothetical protein
MTGDKEIIGKLDYLFELVKERISQEDGFENILGDLKYLAICKFSYNKQ